MKLMKKIFILNNFVIIVIIVMIKLIKIIVIIVFNYCYY